MESDAGFQRPGKERDGETMTDGPHGHPEPELAAKAADPTTAQAELHRLAADHPELRPLIAENPNTYQDLLDWMVGLRNPEIDAALARRPAATGAQGLPPQSEQPTEALGGLSAPTDDEAATFPVAPQQPIHPQHHPVGYAQPDTYVQPDPYVQQWQGQPAGNDQFFGQEPETETRRGGRAVLIVLIALLAVGALAASVFLFLGSPFGGNDAQTTAEQQPAPAKEQQEEEAEQPTEQEESPSPESSPSPTDEEDDEDTEEEPERPAPEDALEIDAFSTPSGNIHCEMTEDEALCTIDWHEFDAPDGCESGTTLRVTEDGAEEACGSSVGAQPISLDYEASATNGDFACESTEEGVRCWSTRTGEGFLIAAAEYDLFG